MSLYHTVFIICKNIHIHCSEKEKQDKKEEDEGYTQRKSIKSKEKGQEIKSVIKTEDCRLESEIGAFNFGRGISQK